MDESGFAEHAANDAVFTTKALLISAASAIPVIGAPISTAITLWEGEKISRRIEKLVEEADRLAQSIKDHLDTEFVKTEEFQDVVLAAIDAGRRTSGEEKRRLVAAILVAAATKDRPPELEADALLDAVATLSPREVRILRAIRDRHAGTFEKKEIPLELQPDLDFHLRRIEAAGLIYEAIGGIGYAGGRYNVTPTFDRLFSFVEATTGPLEKALKVAKHAKEKVVM